MTDSTKKRGRPPGKTYLKLTLLEPVPQSTGVVYVNPNKIETLVPIEYTANGKLHTGTLINQSVTVREAAAFIIRSKE